MRSWRMPSLAPSLARRVSVPVVPSPRTGKASATFKVKTFLNSTGLGKRIVRFQTKDTVFAQGDSAKNIFYIQEGGVRLTVVQSSGKEAVLTILGPGDFVGEGCLAGQSAYAATATAITPAAVLVIAKREMSRVLREEHEFSDRFIAYVLARSARVEADLIDQLFNNSEKRLARTLLLLAHYGEPGKPQEALPKVSQEMLAEMVGTTRSRISTFMNKFRKLGYIEYNGEIRVHGSLLSVVLHN
jgi:CRP/FNR family cyclic AMP-dependent transcriptional regulator